VSRGEHRAGRSHKPHPQMSTSAGGHCSLREYTWNMYNNPTIPMRPLSAAEATRPGRRAQQQAAQEQQVIDNLPWAKHVRALEAVRAVVPSRHDLGIYGGVTVPLHGQATSLSLAPGLGWTLGGGRPPGPSWEIPERSLPRDFQQSFQALQDYRALKGLGVQAMARYTDVGAGRKNTITRFGQMVPTGVQDWSPPGV